MDDGGIYYALVTAQSLVDEKTMLHKQRSNSVAVDRAVVVEEAYH